MKETSFDIDESARMQFAEAVEVPGEADMDANTMDKIRKMAKEKFGDEFVKVICTYGQWLEFKEDKYPYRVMHLSLPVAVIIKRGDKYLMNRYDITRSPNGGNWNMMVKMGSTFVPVKYK